MTHGNTRRAASRQHLDRQTWPDTLVVVTAFDTLGVGEASTGVIDFGAVFEQPPFFSYGVELQEGNALVSGDYPFVTAGVLAWETKEPENEWETMYYTGAEIWVRIAAVTSYPLRFRFTFEGVAMRNVEYFRGSG